MENEKGKKKLTKTASFHNEVCVASWSEGCSEKELRVTETMCYVSSEPKYYSICKASKNSEFQYCIQFAEQSSYMQAIITQMSHFEIKVELTID